MPICITCSHPVKNLYTTYSKADDRSLGKGVRLTQCPNCKRFADKYVEHDYVVLFIDLVLIKPQVYRHLLFNRLQPALSINTSTQSLDPSILRLGILLILFDVYITWARIERVNTPSPSATVASTSTLTLATPPNSPTSRASNFSNAPIITQYLFFLTLNVIATLVQHGVIRGLAKILLKPRHGHDQAGDGTELLDADGNSTGISTSDSKSQHARASSSPSKLNRTSSGQQPSNATATRSQVSVASAPSASSTPTPDDNAPRSPLGLSITNGTGSNGNAHASQAPLQHPISSSTSPPTPSQSQSQPQPPIQTNSTPDPSPPPEFTTPSARANAISTALLVSSCTKLFPILLVIWPTSTSTSTSSTTTPSPTSTTGLPPPSPVALPPFAYRATSYIGWIVLVNNIEALLILLDCGYVIATALAVAGLVSRWVVEGWLLGFVGLVRDMEAEGPVGDVLGLVGWVARLGRCA